MRIGIIGVGHLAASILAGLRLAGVDAKDITLSPRGKGAALAAQHGYDLAENNAALVSGTDAVILTVRPVAAARAVEGLPWRGDQLLLSACAGVPIAALSAAKPARVVRIMPLTASELSASPTLVYPADPAALAFLEKLGSPIPLVSEAEFEAATVSAAIYGWAQSLIRDGAEWSAQQGLAPETARQLVSLTFVAAGRMIAEKDAPIDALLAELVTPGGITEAGLKHLDQMRVPEAWRGACDVVLKKLCG